METKMYNSKLRALLSIRNFNKSLERHYEQMKQIEDDVEVFERNALSTIETHCSKEAQEKWKSSQRDVKNSISAIREDIKCLQKKIVGKEGPGSSELWENLNFHKDKLKERYQASEKIGFEILPESVHKHWQKDICNFEDTILSLIIFHADTCKLELQMIEKYSPKELKEITQVIANHIPEHFTFEQADKYEKDYLKAVEELKKEFSQKKNLWDKFLDILAGGKHQSPAQRVMMQRWVDGEMEDEL